MRKRTIRKWQFEYRKNWKDCGDWPLLDTLTHKTDQNENKNFIHSLGLLLLLLLLPSFILLLAPNRIISHGFSIGEAPKRKVDGDDGMEWMGGTIKNTQFATWCSHILFLRPVVVVSWMPSKRILLTDDDDEHSLKFRSSSSTLPAAASASAGQRMRRRMAHWLKPSCWTKSLRYRSATLLLHCITNLNL